MAYHRHDPLGEHPGYQGNDYESHSALLNEEEVNKYNSNKYDPKKDDPLSGGYRAHKEEEEKKHKELSEFEKQLEPQKPKYEKKLDEETIKRIAAEEVNREMMMLDVKGPMKSKKTKSSIEDAIEMAIKN
jgi:hypothetical protein